MSSRRYGSASLISANKTSASSKSTHHTTSVWLSIAVCICQNTQTSDLVVVSSTQRAQIAKAGGEALLKPIQPLQNRIDAVLEINRHVQHVQPSGEGLLV